MIRKMLIVIWLDRLMITWASVWFLKAVIDAAQGDLIAALIGFICQGAVLWLFFCKFLPRDKERLQIELDRKTLDRMDW